MSNLKDRLLQLETTKKEAEIQQAEEYSNVKIVSKEAAPKSEPDKVLTIAWKSIINSKNVTQYEATSKATLELISQMDKVLSDCFYQNQMLKISYGFQTSENIIQRSLKLLVHYFEDCHQKKKECPTPPLNVENIIITIKPNYTELEINCSDTIKETSNWIKSIESIKFYEFKNPNVTLKNLNKSLLGELNLIQVLVKHDWEEAISLPSKGVFTHESI